MRRCTRRSDALQVQPVHHCLISPLRAQIPEQGINLLAILFGDNYFAVAARGIQLDPATRTGWTYGPLNSEVQEFSY